MIKKFLIIYFLLTFEFIYTDSTRLKYAITVKLFQNGGARAFMTLDGKIYTLKKNKHHKIIECSRNVTQAIMLDLCVAIEDAEHEALRHPTTVQPLKKRKCSLVDPDSNQMKSKKRH